MWAYAYLEREDRFSIMFFNSWTIVLGAMPYTARLVGCDRQGGNKLMLKQPLD